MVRFDGYEEVVVPGAHVAIIEVGKRVSAPDEIGLNGQVFEMLAFLDGCKAHASDVAHEVGSVLCDALEADGFERNPAAVRVLLEGPPLVPAIHLLYEREVSVYDALAYCPVARVEEVGKVVHREAAVELIRVFLHVRIVLPVVSPSLQPSVLLANGLKALLLLGCHGCHVEHG